MRNGEVAPRLVSLSRRFVELIFTWSKRNTGKGSFHSSLATDEMSCSIEWVSAGIFRFSVLVFYYSIKYNFKLFVVHYSETKAHKLFLSVSCDVKECAHSKMWKTNELELMGGLFYWYCLLTKPVVYFFCVLARCSLYSWNGALVYTVSFQRSGVKYE